MIPYGKHMLEEDDVVPPKFGEVVCNACADYPATDHHHLGLSRKVFVLS